MLNLDVGVREEVRKQYIAYGLTTNFVEVVALAGELKLFLDIAIDELNDPNGLGRDVTSVGHWGTGKVELRLADPGQLEDVMALVRQSFERQGEEGYEEPQWSQAGVERVVEEAADPALQGALRAVVEGAVSNGLYPRPWKRSLMFAPPANRSRALFTLTIRDDDQVDLWCAAEAFQTFYALEPAEVERQLGPAGPTTLQAEEVVALVDRLDELMADAEAVTDGSKPTPPWNGRDFYVTIGDRSWEDAMRYGYVSAGGGAFWTKPLEKPKNYRARAVVRDDRLHLGRFLLNGGSVRFSAQSLSQALKNSTSPWVQPVVVIWGEFARGQPRRTASSTSQDRPSLAGSLSSRRSWQPPASRNSRLRSSSSAIRNPSAWAARGRAQPPLEGNRRAPQPCGDAGRERRRNADRARRSLVAPSCSWRRSGSWAKPSVVLEEVVQESVAVVEE